MEGSSGGDMKSLKLRKEDALVGSKWRRLIRGTVEDSDCVLPASLLVYQLRVIF